MTQESGGGFAGWLERAGSSRGWVHALVAFVIGAVFAIFLRQLGFAGLVQSMFLPLAVVTGVVAAIAFGSIGRIFTRHPAGWILLLTALPWGAVAGLASFIDWANQGTVKTFDPVALVLAGLVSALPALLPYKIAPRVVGIVLILAAIGGAVLYAVTAP